MNIFESFKIAWTALLTNKVRALLTMLGIIIGVSAVISMLAIGNGLANGIQSDFSKLGVGVFYISPDNGSPDAENQRPPRLTAEDAECDHCGRARRRPWRRSRSSLAATV